MPKSTSRPSIINKYVNFLGLNSNFLNWKYMIVAKITIRIEKLLWILKSTGRFSIIKLLPMPFLRSRSTDSLTCVPRRSCTR
jgi:hypothetical protein